MAVNVFRNMVTSSTTSPAKVSPCAALCSRVIGINGTDLDIQVVEDLLDEIVNERQ